MKKVLSTVLLLSIMLSVSVQAAGPVRAPSINHSLSFSGTTATCSASVRAEPSDSVSVVAKLWSNGICRETWSGKGTGVARTGGTKTVSRGTSYTLTIDATINGVTQPRQSVTKTCP